MSLTHNTSHIIDPKQALELVWGVSAAAWNFFSNNGLQPSAAVYFTNCALYGGDSDGWAQSLREYALIRPKNGFELGKLRIGYPGESALPTLLGAEYGTRWLGVLSVLATLESEHEAGEDLAAFLRCIKPHVTREYVLDLEQCEKLWSLSRQVFLNSPYWYEFLDIVTKCIQELGEKYDDPNYNSIELIFPPAARPVEKNDTRFFPWFMKPAFDIYQLSQREESRGKTIIARGSVGCAQLIFYLSVVCGLHVTIRSNQEHSFGCPVLDQPAIMIELLGRTEAPAAPWQIGYLVEDRQLSAVVVDALLTIPPEKTWGHGHVAGIPRGSSQYRVDHDQFSERAGEILMPQHGFIIRRIQALGIEKLVSSWFAKYVHGYLHYHRVYWQERNKGICDAHRMGPAEAKTKAKRVHQALHIFAPGLLTEEDTASLLDDLIKQRDPEDDVYLQSRPGTFFGRPEGRIDEEFGFENFQDITEIDIDCKIKAEYVWIASYLAGDIQYLRDVGPLPGSGSLQIQEFYYPSGGSKEHCSVDRLLQVVSRRLAGHPLDMTENCLGRVAGGCVVGVVGNEEYPLMQDPGHAIWFLPGALQYEGRSKSKVIQKSEIGTYFKLHSRPVTSELDLCSAPNVWSSEPSIEHEIFPASDALMLEQKVVGIADVQTLNVIDSVPIVREINSCLPICSVGRTDASGLTNIRLITAELPLEEISPGYQDITSRTVLSVPGKVSVIFARGQPFVHRALISMFLGSLGHQLHDYARGTIEKLALTDGACLPCAVRQAADEGVQVLLVC